MSDKSKIGLIGTGRIGHVQAANIASLPEAGFGDDRATQSLTDTALRSAAKGGSVDVDPNA
jgi:hypothetical protein